MGTVSPIRAHTYTLEAFSAEVRRIRDQLRATVIPLYVALADTVLKAHESGFKRSDIAAELGNEGTSLVDKLLRVARWDQEQKSKALASCTTWTELDRHGRQPKKLPVAKAPNAVAANTTSRVEPEAVAVVDKVPSVAEVVSRATVAVPWVPKLDHPCWMPQDGNDAKDLLLEIYAALGVTGHDGVMKEIKRLLFDDNPDAVPSSGLSPVDDGNPYSTKGLSPTEELTRLREERAEIIRLLSEGSPLNRAYLDDWDGDIVGLIDVRCTQQGEDLEENVRLKARVAELESDLEVNLRRLEDANNVIKDIEIARSKKSKK